MSGEKMGVNRWEFLAASARLGAAAGAGGAARDSTRLTEQETDAYYRTALQTFLFG